MLFDFPDIADFPENIEPVGPEFSPKSKSFEFCFRNPQTFSNQLHRLYEAMERRLKGVDGAACILAAQKSRVGMAAQAYYTLPPTRMSELFSQGVTSRNADTAPLAKFFRDDIAEVSNLIPDAHNIKQVDRAKVRRDLAACGKVQGFLTGLGLLQEASRHRKTVGVASVAVQVSRPGDRHHSQQFADCSTTTRLLNLHMDPKPGILKAIIYLGDVTEENGPFQCVPGSNRWEVDEVQRIFAWGNSVGNYLNTPTHRRVANAFPTRFRRNAIVGRLIADSSDMGELLWRKLVSYTSDSATVMLFDPTFTLHRGGLCKTGERVNLQVVLK